MTPTSNTEQADNHPGRPVVLTPGDPAGIGPDIAVSISRHTFDFGLVVVADPELLQARAQATGVDLEISEYKPDMPLAAQSAGGLTVLPCKLDRAVIPGQPDPANAAYILSTLDLATDGCINRRFAAMVTGPVHKAVLNQAGFPFSGHTEYIAGRCGNVQPVMMLMNRHLRVALVTTHLPLSVVPGKITAGLIESVIRIVNHDLITKFGISRPRLLVCGLNPHAGERGYLGKEEQMHIEPAIDTMRKQGISVTGPVPADTAFTADTLRDIDVVITMYHDQGLPVLKAQGFGETVNVTLGLPIIRTSVDHGTAFDLAATGKARDTSLLAALDCAYSLTRNRG